VCSHLLGGGIAHFTVLDSYAGWRFILLVGLSESDRLKGRGQTNSSTVPLFFLLTFLFGNIGISGKCISRFVLGVNVSRKLKVTVPFVLVVFGCMVVELDYP